MKLFPRIFPRGKGGKLSGSGSLRECFNGKLIRTEAFLIQQDERTKEASSRYETSPSNILLLYERGTEGFH